MLYASSSNSMEQPLTLVAQAVGHWHRPPFLTMMSNALEQKQPLKLALISIPTTALHLKGFGLPAIQDLVPSFCLLPNYTGHQWLFWKTTNAEIYRPKPNLFFALSAHGGSETQSKFLPNIHLKFLDFLTEQKKSTKGLFNLGIFAEMFKPIMWKCFRFICLKYDILA